MTMTNFTQMTVIKSVIQMTVTLIQMSVTDITQMTDLKLSKWLWLDLKLITMSDFT